MYSECILFSVKMGKSIILNGRLRDILIDSVRLGKIPLLWIKQNECAPCKDSDQPRHTPSLIRVFPVRSDGN